jgi:hypothetical protein
MLIRAFIRFFKPRVKKFHLYAPDMTAAEEETIMELVTGKNYVPHRGPRYFGSFNTAFKEFLFSMPAFCLLFRVYHSKEFNEHKI